MLTQDEIKALAPDSASMTAAKKLAKPDKWRRVGRDGEVIWGVALGSDGSLYATFVRASSQTLLCSCPSRKHPCKHTLGLLLLESGGHTLEEIALPQGHRYSSR